ncbi:NAD-dependent epimerase/dehydratase family protein [Synechococcus sp. CCAP 1479/9]|uniref:NAD-dependent epimerase/dehydratase family protein n=1 Tax=Synechococcus sp. CCAP 1479/9 TaxID=1221593 RepID=UPI001C20F9BF|nr:NAD-dependent epimerase/dehydratase family protein [Synechococcus sp. CCAP 1479/9]
MPDPSNEALTVAVTGASGALGQALLRRWHRRGARLIALTHSPAPLQLAGPDGQPIPLRQVHWQVGQEAALDSLLEEVDLLVINHGINVHGDGGAEATGRSLEVNALSAWRLLELFAVVVQRREPLERDGRRRPEVWVNTSEAEIQPAVSPLYEISKRLLGQLLSLRAPALAPTLRLRRLVLGPFRSALNPVGVMGADWVAGEILRQADWNCSLIIVTPNPLTFVLMPLATLTRWAYMSLLLRR